MVQHGKLDFLCVSFLIAGHTKFLPDLSFAKIAKDYNRSDVFNTQELKDVIALHADVVVDQGEIVCDWRTKFDAQSTSSTLLHRLRQLMCSWTCNSPWSWHDTASHFYTSAYMNARRRASWEAS